MEKKKFTIIIIAMAVVIVGLIGAIIAINVKKPDKTGVEQDMAEGDNQDDVNNGQNNAGNGENSDTASNNTGLNDSSSVGSGVYHTSGSGEHTYIGTEKGSGYEGIEGTGKYNYGEALQKSLLFYELQRSGELPKELRCNWRGESCLNDGADNNLDLTGGWYDAGDHVKFNLPMSYTAAMLGWSIYEDKAAYTDSKQLEYALANVKWANDYFIKCHPEDEVYYYQVGDGNQDHTWWGPVECLELRMNRPSYAVTKEAPGSAVTGETAASLAVCSIIFKDIDPEYSALCLKHAESLYAFAEKYKSDDGYTAANGFYNSWSGFYDELAWAGAWLYLATDNKDYLSKAESYYPQANQDYDWAMCWDDVHIGAAILLAEITGKDTYKNAAEMHLDYWSTGTANGERIQYTPKGLAWLDSWGSIRYATTTAYLATVYASWDGCDKNKADNYWKFAEAQVNYALGDTGFSYLIGFGDKYPEHPHHRTSQGSYADNMNEPGTAKHTLYGALVGGPDANDGYTDEVSNYNTNEVACDYNAGFTGLLAKMYSKYHGKTLIDFGAVEEINENEIFTEAGINVLGDDFVEIKAYVYNETAWPARGADNVELRYFVDLSEVYKAGGTAADIEVTTNYMQDATSNGLKIWDEEKHIYYLSVTFDGAAFYPGGQQYYKKELQVRMRSLVGVWDNSNDPSFEGLTQGSVIAGDKLAVYENDVLVYGTEPPAGENAGQSVDMSAHGNGAGDGATNNNNGNSDGATNSNNNGNNDGATNNNTNGTGAVGGTSEANGISVKMEYTENKSNTSSIGGMLYIKNNTGSDIALKDLSVSYYFTNEGDKDLQYSCYHAAINGKDGSYTGLNNVAGKFDSANAEDADKVCKMTISDGGNLADGAELVINFNINHSDWSEFNTSNDYSGKKVDNIVVSSGAKVVFGNEP